MRSFRRNSQALLLREFERAVAKGGDVVVASLVLEQLRKVVRVSDDNERHRIDEPSRLFFKLLEPFLAENNQTPRSGQIRRSSLGPDLELVGR